MPIYSWPSAKIYKKNFRYHGNKERTRKPYWCEGQRAIAAPPGESEYNSGSGWNDVFFIPLSYSSPPLPMFPLEFQGAVPRQETRVMGLHCGEGCVILTVTVFDWSTHVTDSGTDGQTDGRTGVSKERAIAYMLSRAKNDTNKLTTSKIQYPSILGSNSYRRWVIAMWQACVITVTTYRPLVKNHVSI